MAQIRTNHFDVSPLAIGGSVAACSKRDTVSKSVAGVIQLRAAL